MKATSAAQVDGADALPAAATPHIKSFASALLAANRARDAFMCDVSFADATWAMLLDLFTSHTEEGRLSLSDLYSSLAVPKATTLRAIARLVEQGHLETEADPHDGRRTLVRLTDRTHLRMSQLMERMQGILMESRTGN